MAGELGSLDKLRTCRDLIEDSMDSDSSKLFRYYMWIGSG